MKLKRREVLSEGELDELTGLEADLCGLCMSCIELMARLARARRAMAPDRLACVIQDCLLPALRDLGSIATEARGHAHSGNGRRADGHTNTARRPS